MVIEADVVITEQINLRASYAAGFEGRVLEGEELNNLCRGLEKNGIISGVGYTHLLTG